MQELKLRLLKLHQIKKLHHALLLVGADNQQLAKFARDLVAEILEDKSDSDLFIISELARDIKVDEVRKIADFLHQTSFNGKGKFIIINSINRLNLNSANALLKLVEEPNSDSFFILIASQLGQLLPTIKSRCQIIKCDENNDEQATTVYDALLDSIKQRKINDAILNKDEFENIAKCYLALVSKVNIARFTAKSDLPEDEVIKILSDKFSPSELFSVYATLDAQFANAEKLNMDKKVCLLNAFNLVTN